MKFLRQMGETKTRWLIGLGTAAVLALLLPTTYVHRTLFPTEDTRYIRRVFAEHTVGQTFHSHYNIDTIQILARSQKPILETLQAHVAEQDISLPVNLAPQDTWVEIDLLEPLPPGEYELVLSAPDIREQAEAVLVRFQVDSTNFEPGFMKVDGEPSYGDIAFRLVNRIPAWAQVPQYFISHPNHLFEMFRVVALASVLYLVTSLVPKSSKAWRYSLWALVIFSVVVRIPTLASIDGVFGGDAFNYLSKTKAWLAGDDPFNADPRKAPLLPFLLIPTFLTNDPLLWSRFLGAISAGAAAVAVAAALRKLKLPIPLALLGGALVSVNREMWWESLNGLANVPYAAFIALSTASLIKNAPFATSLFSVLAALTRYEGILISAVYLPTLWIKNHFRWAVLRHSLVPLILLGIPFVFWPISGALGVRSAADLTGDAGLYIAWDWNDYLSNLDRAKNFLQQLWFLHNEPPLNWATNATYLLALIGAAVLSKRRPAIGLPIIVTIVLQIAAVTAILPKTRYYVQIIPLLAVFVAYGLHLLPRRAGLAIASLLVSSVWVNTRLHLPEIVEDYNYRGRADSPLLQASVFFKKIESRPAFAINFLPVEVYLPRSQAIFGAPEGVDEQITWLREKQATHLVEASEHPWFEELLNTHPQNLEYITSFSASYDPTEATIYKIKDL